MRFSKASRPSALTSLSAIAIFALLATTGHAAWRINQSVKLARASKPFSITPASPSASLLIVGDSTAVGTGASAPEHSLAGQIARTHPGLRIVNLAKDGATFDAIAAQLVGTKRFDMILILGGGNDVIRLTSQARLRENIDRAVVQAVARSDRVILMPAGNVGNAAFFFPPISWWITRRARTLHDAAAESARLHGATFVDLYRERESDPFAREPDRMNARDYLHPSDAGYAFWLAELERQAHVSRTIEDATNRTATTAAGNAPVASRMR